MFLHVSVILFTSRSAYGGLASTWRSAYMGESASRGNLTQGGACLKGEPASRGSLPQGGVCLKGSASRGLPVCLWGGGVCLLDCFLVYSFIFLLDVFFCPLLFLSFLFQFYKLNQKNCNDANSKS